MLIEDSFPRAGRWDSVGLDCGVCKHQANAKWPNRQRNYRCGLHDMSLTIELGKNGYMDGEWFCRDFEDDGRAERQAVEHFLAIRNRLQPRVLYQFADDPYGKHKRLDEHPFEVIMARKIRKT